MTDFFQDCLMRVLHHEGGRKFTDDARDPGGATKYGVSLRFAGSVAFDADHDGDTDAADIKALTLEQAQELYKKYFWDTCNCSQLPPAVAFMVFDAAVNQGVRAAVTDLQRAARVLDDGKIGQQTRLAVHGAYSLQFLNELAARRMVRYAGTRNFDRFGLGWSNRLMDIHAAAVEIFKGVA